MAGQSGCHILPAVLTESNFSNPTQIRQIGGVVYTIKVDISMTLFTLRRKMIKINIINDFEILHNFN